MASPVRSVHVLLDREQIAYLRLQAARRHLSMSAVIRELVERDREREQRAERRSAAR